MGFFIFDDFSFFVKHLRLIQDNNSGVLMKHLFMAFLLLATLPLACFSAEANPKFLTVKERLVKRVDDRIALFTKLRECMDGSQTTKELKQCSDKYASEAKKQSATFKTDRKKINQ